MGKFRTSYELVKLSFKIINKEKELLVYSLISGISSILIFMSFLFLNFDSFSNLNNVTIDSQIITVVYLFLGYFILTFATLFFNTAIIKSVDRILRGKSNSFMEGINDAFSNISKIIIWSLISAFVSTIIKMIQNRIKGVSKYLIGFVGGAWNIATFFAFPLMILGDKKPMDAIKGSSKLFKKGWGEMTIVNVGVGFFFFIMTILLFIISGFLGFLAVTNNFIGLAIIIGVIFSICFVLLILLSMTTDCVIKTLLYTYLETDTLPDYVNKNLLNEMFSKKSK